MKKVTFFILLTIAISLAGCIAISLHDVDSDSRDEFPQHDGSGVTEEHLHERSDNASSNSNRMPLTSITDFHAGAGYTVTPMLFEEGNVKVSFPKVDGFDEERQAQINNLILNEKHRMLGSLLEWGDELTLNVAYEIKKNSDGLLSIVYTGLGNVQSAAHPFWVFHTLNINVENGEKITLSDVIAIDENFVELLKSDRAVFTNPLQREPVISEFISAESFLKKLQCADNSAFAETESNSDVFTYFTCDSLGIGIALPHVLGGYATVEIKY